MPRMNPKFAIGKAKHFAQEIFGDEAVTDLAVEEIEFDSDKNVWNVTLGFTRPWDRSHGFARPDRTYKIFVVADAADGDVASVKNREVTV